MRRHKGLVVDGVARAVLACDRRRSAAPWGMIQANAAAKRESSEKKRAEVAEEETLEAFRASTDDAIEQLSGFLVGRRGVPP